MASDFLKRMADTSRERVQRAQEKTPFAYIRSRAMDQEVYPLKFQDASFNIIAEVKLRSPSAGVLASESLDYIEQAKIYAEAGATAVSVLTEPDAFAGSLQHLEACSKALAQWQTPTMRKDFLVDPYQIFEARAFGASGALVIIRMVQEPEMDELLDAAKEAGLFVLLEAFDDEDLAVCDRLLRRRSWDKHTTLVGLNCRNLRTLEIEPERFFDLVEAFPSAARKVAESGLTGINDVVRVSKAGYDLALIGSALMQSESPGTQLSDMLYQARQS